MSNVKLTNVSFTLDRHLDTVWGSETKHNYRTFDGTDDYIELPTLTASGDFEVSVEFALTDSSSSWRTLFGNDSWTAELGFILYVTDGAVRFANAGSGVNVIGSKFVSDGEKHTVLFTRVGEVHTLYVDGVFDSSTTGTIRATSHALSAYLGARHSNDGTAKTSYFPGIISNVNFISGWVASDGTENPTYPLDDSADVIRNSNAVLGSELVSSYGVPVGYDNTIDSQTSSSFATTGDTTATRVYANIATEAGKTYTYSYTIDTLSSGFVVGYIRAEYGGVGTILVGTTGFSAGAIVTGVFTATTSESSLLLVVDTAVDFSCSNISVREAPAYALANNFQSDYSDLALYTQQPDGNWLGENLVTNGTFDSDLSGWTINNADGTHSVTWVDGEARYQGDTTSPQLQFDQGITSVVVGDNYLLSADVSAAGLKTGVMSHEVNLLAGSNSYYFTSLSATLRLYRNTTDVDVDIDNVSVQHLIQTTPQLVGTSRNFATFDGTDDYVSVPSISASGSWSLSLKFSTTDTNLQGLLNGSDATNDFLRVQSDGKVRAKLAGLSFLEGTALVDDGQFHTVDLAGSASGLSISVDGVVDATDAQDWSGFNVDSIGVYDSGNYFNGTIANVNFKSGFVASDGTTNPYYELSDADNVCRNTGLNSELGDELVTNGDFSTDSDWTKGAGWTISGGVASANVGGSIHLKQDAGLVTGKVYIATVETLTSTSGVLRFFDGASTIVKDISAVGVHTIVFTASGVDAKVASSSGGFVGSIDNFSIREAPAYATYENFESDFSDRELFTMESSAGDWIGSTEIWDVNDLINDNSGDWSSTVVGTYELNGSTGTLMRPFGATISYPVQTSFDWVKVSGSLQVGGGGGINTITASGSYIEAGADNVAFGFKRSSGTVVGTLSNVSAKRILEKP